MDVTCTDWQLTIKLPKEMRIDRSWNGEYIPSQDEILVIPDEERNTIKPGDSVTIGFVGYSFWTMKLAEFTFTAYRDIPFWEYSGIKVVMFALALWCFGVVGYIAMLHDCGKIGIPDTILLKDGKLNSYEWDLMKQHPQIGADILSKSEKLTRIAAIIPALRTF